MPTPNSITFFVSRCYALRELEDRLAEVHHSVSLFSLRERLVEVNGELVVQLEEELPGESRVLVLADLFEGLLELAYFEVLVAGVQAPQEQRCSILAYRPSPRCPTAPVVGPKSSSSTAARN